MRKYSEIIIIDMERVPKKREPSWTPMGIEPGSSEMGMEVSKYPFKYANFQPQIAQQFAVKSVGCENSGLPNIDCQKRSNLFLQKQIGKPEFPHWPDLTAIR